MKNKRVLYIFLTLFFIVTIVLLSSVLFSVNGAFISPVGDVTDIDQQKVQEQLDACIGKNIFFIDEKAVIEDIEKENPYIKAINIERIFPSTIKLHFTRRKELFEMEKDGTYFVMDSEAKVLRTGEQCSGLALLDIDYSDGAQVSDILSSNDISDALLMYNAFTMLTAEQRQYDESLFNAYFERVYKESNDNINLVTNYGCEICLVNFKIKTAEKLYTAFLILDGFDDQQRATENIRITE